MTSRVISTLIGVAPIITPLITYLLSPLGLQVNPTEAPTFLQLEPSSEYGVMGKPRKTRPQRGIAVGIAHSPKPQKSQIHIRRATGYMLWVMYTVST